MLQLIDESDERLHVWAGGAAGAIRCRKGFEETGRTVVVADSKGRRLSPSDLVEMAILENERQATASFKEFWRLQRPGSER